MRQNEVRREGIFRCGRGEECPSSHDGSLNSGDAEQGAVALKVYHSVLDKAKEGVLKKNTAIRRNKCNESVA